jgi:hypothetical protein
MASVDKPDLMPYNRGDFRARHEAIRRMNPA